MKSSFNINHVLVSLLVATFAFAVFIVLVGQVNEEKNGPQYVYAASSSVQGAVEVSLVDLAWVTTSPMEYFALVQEIKDEGRIGYVKLTREKYVEFTKLKVSTFWAARK